MVMAGMMAWASGVNAETYQVDPVHSTVGFSVKHLAISTVRGVFTNFEGTIEFDAKKPEASKASGTVKVASVNTQMEARDKHLRSPDFFDADKYPEIQFQMVSARKDGDAWVVKGRFTMHGVMREIELRGTIEGPVKDPWGKTRIGLSASTTINRQDFGLTWSKKMDSGGLVVGDLVKIELEIEAVAK
jgi:polyisoprenoid-binding protein YceI